jgi:S1-C subfamily serine protease
MYGEQELALITGESAQGPYPLDLSFNEPDKIYEGICTLDERELKICFNSRRTGLKERPDSFSLDGHPERRLLSFERVKPDEIKPSPGFVGMALRFDDEKKEVVVVSVLEHSPAMAAELRKDDVLVAIGGAGPGGLREAVAAVRRAKPGDQLKLRVRRDGKEEELSIKVGMFPLGLLLELG